MVVLGQGSAAFLTSWGLGYTEGNHFAPLSSAFCNIIRHFLICRNAGAFF